MWLIWKMCECSYCSSARGGLGQISSRSWFGGFLTLVDQWVAVGAVPVTFVALPVDGFCRTTAVGGYLGVSIGLVAVGAAGGLGVAGATGAVAGAAVTGFTGNNPCEDSGVAGATLVLGSTSGLTTSGWHSWMWSCVHLYWPPPMTWTKYEPRLVWWMIVAGSQRVLASLSTETVCPAYSGDFGLQWQSWYAALWVAWSLRWSRSAATWGSLCLILWGTVVLITLW